LTPANRTLSCSECSKRSTHTRRSASGADTPTGLPINLACPRPCPTMRVPRDDRPCNRRGRRCLLARWHHPLPEPRTPPAGTLPPVVSNVRFANSLLGFLITLARVGPRSQRGMLSTIMEPLKIVPVPLGASQIPTHKPSRRCCVLRRFRLNLPPVICPCASRRDTRHERDARRDPRRAPRPRHAHRSLAAPVGQHARLRARRIFSLWFWSSSSLCRPWCVQDVQKLPQMPRTAENQGRVSTPR